LSTLSTLPFELLVVLKFLKRNPLIADEVELISTTFACEADKSNPVKCPVGLIFKSPLAVV